MRVLWVNEAADFVGGCEQYIFNTARLLHDHGVRSSLLYDCQNRLSPDFVKPFEQAFPMVDIRTQVAEIKPDLIYVHRLSGRRIVEELRETRVPAARFFHLLAQAPEAEIFFAFWLDFCFRSGQTKRR